jgi:hypothetical protein
MRLPSLDLSPSGETLLAIVIGALLATASGMFATQYEAWMRRREKERDAALLIGEIFATMQILLGNADRSRLVGNPWGHVTMRILRGVRREIDIYDRNRERLYDLRIAGLRVRIHALMVRTAMPLDGILDLASDLAGRPDDPALASARALREQAFAVLMQNAGQMSAIIDDLRRLARRGLAEADVIASVAAAPTDTFPEPSGSRLTPEPGLPGAPQIGDFEPDPSGSR